MVIPIIVQYSSIVSKYKMQTNLMKKIVFDRFFLNTPHTKLM